MRFIDIARSAYAGSPAPVRRTVAPILARVPPRLRYGATFGRWHERIDHSRADPDYSFAETTSALRDLFTAALEGSPFWRARLAGSPCEPGEMNLADLRYLPIVTKADLKAAGDTVLAVAAEKVVRATTSGSNAEPPFEFYIDRDRSVREYAFVTSAWARAGFKVGQARAVLRGFSLEGGRTVEWEAALGELRMSVFPMGSGEVDEMADAIDARNIRYLHGYPSAIEIFCRQLLASGRQLRQPIRGILPISEPVHPHQRRIFAEALGEPTVAPFYGLSEKVLFAAELAGTDGVYEFEPLYGIPELVDAAGDPVTQAGRSGRLIGTGLISRGMPFIRYDTGDDAELVQTPSRANGWRMRVRNIAPRRRAGVLFMQDGSPMSATDLVPEDTKLFEGIAEYQFVQREHGVCDLLFVPVDGADTSSAAELAAVLTQRTRDAIRFMPKRAKSLVSGTHGKRAFVVLHGDLAASTQR